MNDTEFTDELKNLMILNNIPLIGPVRIKRLLDFFGSASNVLSASIEDLVQVEGINLSIAKSILSYKNKFNPYKEIETLKNNDVNLIPYYDQNYPEALKYLTDPPILLYVKGEIKPSDLISISIVGTRKPTTYGKLVVEHLIKGLAKYNLTIISGLAYGIDTLAHEYAIKYGLRTIAVLGNGLGVYYPQANRKLQQGIPSYGAVISEFSYFSKPSKSTFPQRNRIIAALSLGTVVVEADIKSGALITAKFAAELGKDVFAVPGSIFSKQSMGANYLIKNGAKLVTEAEDIVEEIKHISDLFKQRLSNLKQIPSKKLQVLEDNLSENAKRVLDIISLEPEGIHIDKLQNISNIEMPVLMQIIFELQLASKVKEMPGKIYISI